MLHVAARIVDEDGLLRGFNTASGKNLCEMSDENYSF
jgi:hypothetical protein